MIIRFGSTLGLYRYNRICRTADNKLQLHSTIAPGARTARAQYTACPGV